MITAQDKGIATHIALSILHVHIGKMPVRKITRLIRESIGKKNCTYSYTLNGVYTTATVSAYVLSTWDVRKILDKFHDSGTYRKDVV